jgi:hypothetical protein
MNRRLDELGLVSQPELGIDHEYVHRGRTTEPKHRG